MARRGENIRKRQDGRWEARYSKGRNADGSIRYGYVYADKYLEVKQKRNDILQTLQKELETRQKFLSIEDTFGGIFNEWKQAIRHNIKDSSYFYYETLLEHHLRPKFGNIRVGEITSNMIQEFIEQKIQENLSSSYIRSIVLLLQNILKYIQTQRQQPLPVFTYQLPKASSKKVPDVFTLQEWQFLESYLKRQHSDFAFGILLCMYTGLRIGELSGLKWGDFDPINVQFKIRRTVYRIKNVSESGKSDSKTILRIGSPKTATSIRDIPLPFSILELLQKHQKASDTYILTGTEHCMEPRNIQKRYKTLLKRAGLRYLNFHALRHNFATLSIQSGSDYKTVAELLGHSSVNTTLNIYVHSSIERKRQCLELLMK